jgi:hypothetical protein
MMPHGGSIALPKQSASRDKSHWWRIQAKCLDCVLVDAITFAPRLVIELDDRSYDCTNRQARDAFVDSVLAAIAIPILHIRWPRHYDTGELAAQIVGQLGCTPRHEALGLIAPKPDVAATGAFWRPMPAPEPITLPQRSTPVIKRSAPGSTVILPTPMRLACGTCQAELHEGATFCARCGDVFA